MTLSLVLPAVLPPVPGAEREAILDAILRATLGLDHKDKALFDSALVDDVTLDFGGNTVHGRAAVHAVSFALTSRVDISHFVANQRVLLHPDGSTASITASAQAYHYPAGKNAPRLVNGTSFALEVVKTDSGLWKITYWKIMPMWSEGDASIMSS